MTAVARAWHGVRWYLKQFTGESRWDDYLAACRTVGIEPTTRREFERHRADQIEHAPMARCC